MSDRELFEIAAAQEGWHERTQIDVLLQYIENQDSSAAFEDFLAQMRSDALSDEYADDADATQDTALASATAARPGHSGLNSS